MKPLPDKIRVLRDDIFTSGGAISPLAAQADPTAAMQADGSRVRVLNGSFTPGLDVNTGNYLIGLGVPVTEVGTADRAYDNTTVILYGPKLYTLWNISSLCLASPTLRRSSSSRTPRPPWISKSGWGTTGQTTIPCPKQIWHKNPFST